MGWVTPRRKPTKCSCHTRFCSHPSRISLLAVAYSGSCAWFHMVGHHRDKRIWMYCWEVQSETGTERSHSPAQQSNAGQGRLILEVSRSHIVTHYSWWDSSGRGIGPSQRSLPDNTQHWQQTDIHASGGIRTRNPCKRSGSSVTGTDGHGFYTLS